MRKELLLSLVAAGVIPTAALANIDVTAQTGINDATKWANNGLGSVAANGDLLNGGSIVVSGASAGSLSFDIDVKASKLPVGNYVINATGENLKLTINGEVTNKFTLTGSETTVAVKIEGKTPGEYSLTGLTLEIDLNFAELQAKLNALTEEVAENETGKYTIQSDTVAITAVDYKDADGKAIEGRQYYTGLAVNENALKADIDAMRALIAKLDNENLETYLDEELELWTEPSGLQKKLQALLNKIAARNAEVEKQNTLSANWGANQTEKDKLAGELKTAKDAVDKLDLTDEFVAAQTQEALNAFNEYYNLLNGRLNEFDVDTEIINKAGKQAVDEEGNSVFDEEGNPVWVYEPFDVNQLNSLKAAVEDAQKTAIADAAAYAEIQTWINDIKKEYNKHLTEFMELHVGNQSATWTSELTAIRDAAVAKLEEIEKIGASTKKADAKQTKDDAIQDLKDKCDTVMAAAQASNDAYATQDAELEAVVEDLANVKADIDKIPGEDLLPNAKADLSAQYDEIAAALAEARTFIDGNRDEYACVEETLNLAPIEANITDLKAKLAEIQAKVTVWQNNEDAIKALEDALKAAQEALITANSDLQGILAGADVNGVDLVAQFGEAYQGCVNAIDFSRTTNNNNLKEGKSDDIKLGYTETGVNEYVAKAAPTAKKFTAAVTAYKGLNDDLTDLKKLINGGTVLPGNALGDKKTYTDKWRGYEDSINKILDGIKTAAGKKADAIYEAIAAVVLDPDGVKEAIDTDHDTFAVSLIGNDDLTDDIKGNKDIVLAKIAEYEAKTSAADAEATYGPGLEALKKAIAEQKAKITESFQTIAILEAELSVGGSGVKEGNNTKLNLIADGKTDTGYVEVKAIDKPNVANVYIQYNLKDEYNEVTLAYAPRQNSGNGSCGKLIVKGSNTADGEYIELATVDVVKAAQSPLEKHPVDLKKYKYIRISPDAFGFDAWRFSELHFEIESEGPTNTDEYLALNDKICAANGELANTVGALEARCLENVKSLADYHTAYDNTITDLDEWVEENSNNPATDNWLDKDNKKSGYGQIVKDKDALDKAIEEAYKVNNLSGNSEKEKKDALSTAITNFKNAVTANEDNHNAQLGYAEEAITAVKNAIDAVQNAGYDDGVTFKLTVDGEEVETNLAGVLDILKDLQKGLQGLNKQVSDDYANLESKADNVYADLVAQVEAIVDAVASDYYRAVKEANLETANAAMNGQYNGLNDAYKAAVALYNRFTAEIAGNDPYNTYIGLLKEEIDTEHGHAELQKHYQTMRELQKNIDEILAAALPALGEEDASKYKILDATAFDGIKDDVAAAVKAMEDYNSALTSAVNDFASTYIGGQFGETTDFILEQTEIMTTAQMPEEEIEDALAEAKTHVALALAYLDTDYDNTPGEDGTVAMPTPGDLGDVLLGNDPEKIDEAIEKYFINMPAVLSELALVDINTLDILKNFWNTEYANALETLAGYQARYDEAAKGALAADLALAQEYLSQATGNIAQLNVWAQNWMQGSPAGFVAELFGKGYSYSEFDDLGLPTNVVIPSLVPELAAQLELAKQGAERAEAAQQKNIDNMAAIAGYKKEADDLKAALAKMHATIGTLGLTVDEFAQIPTEAADEAYNEFAGLLVDEDGNDITNAIVKSCDIEYWRDLTKQNIETAYAEAYDVELAFVKRLLADIQADFNKKYEAGELENADALDELIAEQRDRINNLPTVDLYDTNEDGTPVVDENGDVIITETVTLKNDETVQTLKDIEDKLFAIELGTITPNEDATDIVKGELDLQADDVNAKIQELAAALAELDEILDNDILSGWRHTPVADANTDVMAEELAAIIAAYEADNSVETKGSYYENLLNELLDKANTGLANVDAAKTEAQNEIAKREISNAWADAMDAEIAAVEEYYNNVLADIAEYKYPYNNAEWYEAKINGNLETDEDGNVIGGGLIALAKYRIAQAREEFSLNNSNTYWNEKWEAMYDENGDFVESMLVDPQESVHTSLYNLSDIYSTVDNFALYAARTEVNGWRTEAWTEYKNARTAVNNGHHVDQAALNAELSRIYDAYCTISTIFTDVTEFSRNLMTAKVVIDDAKALAALAEANFFTPGDLNKDTKITTSDFVQLVDIILEKVETPEIGTVEFAAADLNEDKEIGVGDAVKEMRLINRVDVASAPARVAAMNVAVECSASMAQGLLNINNNIAIASIMVDVKGASASNITLGSRAAGMQMMTNTLANGNVRVIIIAQDGTTLADNAGTVLNIAGNATLAKVVVSDVNGTEYTLVNNGETTAIESITNAIKSAGQKIYSVGGQMMNTLKKGINIIRNADGSSKKVIK